jgi:hypothetical protein
VLGPNRILSVAGTEQLQNARLTNVHIIPSPRRDAMLMAAFLILSAFRTPAALLVYEGFAPSNGLSTNLVGIAAGTGFATAWRASSTDGSNGVFTRTADAGSFRNGWPRNVGFPPPSGGRVQYNATWTWTSVTRTLSTPINFNTNGQYFLSFLIHDYSTTANDDNRLFLGNSTKRIYMGRGYGAWEIAVGNTTSDPWTLTNVTGYAWPGLKGNSLIFVVAQILTSTSGNATINLKHYCYDPVAGTGDLVDLSPVSVVWDSTYTGTITGTFDQLGISSAGVDWQEIDEIRLGTAWSDVTGTAPPASPPPTGLINLALGPLALGQQVYSGPGPVVGTPGDYWNAVSLSANGTLTYASGTSGSLSDSADTTTAVTVQVGTNPNTAKSWDTWSTSWGNYANLIVDTVTFWGPDAIVVHGLDSAQSYNLYCLGGPWNGDTDEFTVGGVTKTIVVTNSWAVAWVEGYNYCLFTNVPTDGAGNLTITIGKDDTGYGPQRMCGFQIQPVPLTIITQPQTQLVPPGASVKLFVAAAGGSSYPAYRWQANVNGTFVNLSDGGNLAGTATSTLTITNFQATNAASYRAMVTVGTAVTNSNPAGLTTQSGTLTANLTADTNSVFRNPFMGWVIYAVENGDIPKASDYWASQTTPNCPYASTCYLRVLWSEMEPQEGVYAWNSDTNFQALVQGAWDRGLKVAFRVYVNSQDVPQQATPQWAFNAGVPVIDQANDGPDPDIRSPIFQQKYTTFINAFAAVFNDPSKVNWVDASTFGQWGEMNVGIPVAYMTNATDRAQVMQWLCNTYSNAFTRVPSAMNFPSGTWTTSELDSYCFITGCTAMRRDGIAGPYGDVVTSQESAISSRWPGKPFIAEDYYGYPTAAQQLGALAQALFLHANFFDLRESWAAANWTQRRPDWVKTFNLYGGYRFVVGSVTYPGTIVANSNITLQATLQNWGVGVLPNNLKPWNNKYKFAFGLLDSAGNLVKAIVDTAAGDDPSNWTNGTPYSARLDPVSGLPVGLMAGNYWQTNSKTYTLNVTNNFGAVASGSYYLGVAVVDTSNTNKADISLAINAPRTASGWSLVGPIIVRTPPTILTQPQSQIVPQGTTVQLAVIANGTPGPTFQWKKNNGHLADGPTGNGSTISGSVSNVLTIANVQINDSGSYTVGITNSAGGTTSGVAQLLVVPPATAGQAPWLTNASQSDRFGFSFSTLAGYRYLVQRSTNLGSLATWVTLTNLPPAFGSFLFSFTDTYSNLAAFYRASMTNQ